MTPSRFPRIAEASVRVCVPFRFAAQTAGPGIAAALAERCLTDLADAIPAVPAGLRSRIASRDPLPVWEVARPTITRDFHPFVRDLFAPEGEAATTCSEGAPGSASYQLTANADHLLNGEFGKAGPGLTLTLAQVASRRLSGEPERTEKLPLRVHNGHQNRTTLHLFGSGVGLLVLEVTPDAETLETWGAEGLLELVYALAHFRDTPRAITWTGAEDAKPPKASLRDIVTALLPFVALNEAEDCEAPLARAAVGDRVFTYAALRTDGHCPEDEAFELVYRLGKRYSEDYLPAAAALREAVVRPFDNIYHAMHLEGGAVLLADTARDDGRPVPFFRAFIRDQVKEAYWPLAALSYAELIKLLHLTGMVCQGRNFHTPSETDMEELDRYRQDVLNFRLNYRFNQVSRIGQHNDCHAAWRSAFGCEALLQDVVQDVSEVASFLDYRLAKERAAREAARMRRAVSLGWFNTAAGIVFGLALALTSVFGMNLAEFKGVSASDRIFSNALALFALIAVGALWVRWSIEKRSQDPD